MRNKAKGKGAMIVKIDLEKIYDRMSWNFIYKGQLTSFLDSKCHAMCGNIEDFNFVE